MDSDDFRMIRSGINAIVTSLQMIALVLLCLLFSTCVGLDGIEHVLRLIEIGQ